MGKNVAVFFDGTRNRLKADGGTNVHALYEMACAGAGAGANGRQPCLYLAGVGTHRYRCAAVDALRRRAMLGDDYAPLQGTAAGRLLGALAGYGIGGRIREAYAFIVDNVDDMAGDHLFLFGFSRGAFAARSLAGFINEVGLLFRDRLGLVPVAYELYRMGKGRDFLEKQYSRLLGSTVVLGERPIPVYLIGVWDTVGALGLPPPFQRIAYQTDHHLVRVLPPNVKYGRHALALHELRSLFAPVLWERAGTGQSIEQVWFAGAHADVGGGYASSTVSTIPLLWMAEQARALGLEVVTASVDEQDSRAEIHHEIRGVFALQTPQHRAALACIADPAFDGEIGTHYIHSSALRRRDWMEATGNAYPFRRAVREQLEAADRLTRQAAIRTTQYRDDVDTTDRGQEYGDKLTPLKRFLMSVDPADDRQIDELVGLIVLAKLAHGLEQLRRLGNVIEELSVKAALQPAVAGAGAPAQLAAGAGQRRIGTILTALRLAAARLEGTRLRDYIENVALEMHLHDTLPARRVRVRLRKI